MTEYLLSSLAAFILTIGLALLHNKSDSTDKITRLSAVSIATVAAVAGPLGMCFMLVLLVVMGITYLVVKASELLGKIKSDWWNGEL